jgi:hypothetical protein
MERPMYVYIIWLISERAIMASTMATSRNWP